jgi:hypothetical protein
MLAVHFVETEKLASGPPRFKLNAAVMLFDVGPRSVAMQKTVGWGKTY